MIGIAPSLSTMFTSIFLTCVGILLWFLIRKTRERILVPILRVLNITSDYKPKIKYKIPPFFPFLCFAILTFLVVFSSLKPFEKIFVEDDKVIKKALFIVDLSPSMQGRISNSRLIKILDEDLSNSMGKFAVDVISSRNTKVTKIDSKQQISEITSKFTYHKAGFKLDSLLTHLDRQLFSYSNIFIYSDLDESSWKNLNLDYLSSQVNVSLVDVTETTEYQNYYISGVEEESLGRGKFRNWRIHVSRTDDTKESKGTLTVSMGGKNIGQTEVYFKADSFTSSAVVSVNKMVSDQSAGTRDLVVSFKADGLEHLVLDNHFIFQSEFKKGNILVVGEPLGEEFMDDPVRQVVISFEVNGYKVSRWDSEKDFVAPPNTSYEIIFANLAGSNNDFCPSKYFKNNNSIWLTAVDINKNAKDLCQCLSKLIDNDRLTCIDVFDRKTLVNQIRLAGLSPIGGFFDLFESAPFFVMNYDTHYLLLSTVPFDPRAKNGIDHAKLPILIGDLIERTTRSIAKTQSGYFRQIDDITKFILSNEGNSHLILENSNVPKGESIIRRQSFDVGSDLAVANIGEIMNKKRYEKDFSSLLKIIFSVFLGMLLVELTYYLAKLLKTKKRGLTNSALVLISICHFDQYIFAYEGIHVLGKSYGGFKKLEREVANRTSIDISRESEVVVNLDVLEKSNWIWSASKQEVVNQTGSLDDRIVTWIKRGGLLIIQDSLTRYQLDIMTQESFPFERKSGIWKVIPPDHELMRSFYLLDALPSCQGDVWYEYRYDGRMAILVIPDTILKRLSKSMNTDTCKGLSDNEKLLRTFVNINMVALTTDYKKDQIHLPEILKRIR